MSQSISLDGTWKLTWSPMYDAENVPEWPASIDAQVPGDVHMDLVNAGILPEPLVAANAPKHEWVENAAFVYEREFTVDSEFERAELVFEGLDCIAEIFIDGQHVGSGADMFVPYTFDVTALVKPGKKHKLVATVYSGVGWGRQQDNTGLQHQPEPERMFLRKSQFSFKWDWAPRLVTCGIWRGVSLKLYKHAALRDVKLTHAFEGNKAVLYADVEIEAFEAGTYNLKLSARKGDGAWETATDVELAVGLNKKRIQVEVLSVERWWPSGYGDQALYDVNVDLALSDAVVDTHCCNYGFREVVIRQAPAREGETTFIINVNGVDVFCKGANWVPADSILARVSDEKYERLVSEAVDANFNMLRIWGGGIYESDAFYNACDRMGIMIWHDFMFACAEYPDGEKWFMDICEQEARKAVKRLRHHACIAIWCGNNECDWGCAGSFGKGDGKEPKRFNGWKIYHELLPAVCAELDSQRPYWPSSPFGGLGINDECCGDRHAWQVSIQNEDLNYRADVRNYRHDRGKFSSEYGVLSHALPQTIRDYTGEEVIDFKSEACIAHDNFFNNHSTKGEPLTNWYLKIGFDSVPEDELTYLWQSMAYQAMGYREAISDFRIRKFDCAGSLFWMYSDCWGTLGWTIIDYYLRRKPSFYWVKKAYAPVAVFARAEDDVVKTYIVNDTLSEVIGNLTFEVGDLAGEGKSTCCEVTVPANGVVEGPSYEFGAGYAFVRLESGGVPVSEDLILTRFPSELEIPSVKLNTVVQQVGDDVEVRVQPDGFAHFVWIDHPDGAVPTDNAFNVLPNRPRIVRIANCKASDVTVTALNAE